MSQVVRTMKYQRGAFGKLIKWTFIGFNLLMLFWLFSYWSDIAPMLDGGSSAEQAGAAIGSTIGTGLIFMFWAIGAVVLGIPVMLTKGKLVETVEATSAKAQVEEAKSETSAKESVSTCTMNSDGWKSKAKSLSIQLFQAVGFVLFLIVGLAVAMENMISGIGIVIAGSLLLPRVQDKLKNTPIKTPNTIAMTMLVIVVASGYFASANSQSGRMASLQKEAKKAQAEQQSLREAAEKEFARNREQVLQDIKMYADNGNWQMVQTKTEILLGTNDVEILNLNNQAIVEQEKAEKERVKQEADRIINEFKDNRDRLVAELNSEIAKGNYSYAQNIGTQYLSVADEEFKRLHESAVEKYAAEASAAPWSYSHSDDPMSKGQTYSAMLLSSNTVNFDFPYSGAQHGRLILRTHPKHGKDVIFSIEKGQIQCPSYDSCTVRVRFDEEEAVNFTAVGAADNSTETIFLRDYSRFVSKMMKAKRVRISMNIYQEGAPVFEFDVSGFNVARYKPQE